MGARTTAREAALQMLFAIDATGGDVDQAISDFWRELPGDAEGRPYADALVRGVRSDATKLDERIRAASQRRSRAWRASIANAFAARRLRATTRTDVPRGNLGRSGRASEALRRRREQNS